MTNKTLSLTDDIYAELMDGLKTGLDWTQFLARHGTSKGPLYNAIGRFFNNMEPKVRVLNEVKTKLDQAGLELDALDRKIKEAESNLARLENTKKGLNEQIEALNTKLAEKRELASDLAELAKLGFDIKRLRQLQEALREIGVKHGLKGKEAMAKFFSDLQDYDARIGFEREIQRLETITDTKKLEAEKCQAEADSLARRYKDLSEAITAVQALIKHGVKTEQIVSWNTIVGKLGGPEELQGKLEQYKSVSELLDTKKREIGDCDKKVTDLSAQIKVLNEQKVEIEGAIKALRDSGLKQIERMSQQATAWLAAIRDSTLRETERVGSTAVARLRAERDEAFTLLDQVLSRALEVGAHLGRVEERLARVKGTKDEIQSFLKAIEATK